MLLWPSSRSCRSLAEDPIGGKTPSPPWPATLKKKATIRRSGMLWKKYNWRGNLNGRAAIRKFFAFLLRDSNSGLTHGFTIAWPLPAGFSVTWCRPARKTHVTRTVRMRMLSALRSERKFRERDVGIAWEKRASNERKRRWLRKRSPFLPRSLVKSFLQIPGKTSENFPITSTVAIN